MPRDRVAVFDGGGREFVAEIVTADRTAAVVLLLHRVEPAAEPLVPFSLVQALLKGTAMDDVVRDATMLGARTIEPVISSHVAVKRPSLSKHTSVDRWQRVALASAKQCRRAVVPAVHRVRSFETWLKAAEQELRLLFVEPSAELEAQSLRRFIGAPAPASAALIVGPEGGWSRAEVELAVQAGCTAVTLGRLTLRADAVTLAASALFRLLWDE